MFLIHKLCTSRYGKRSIKKTTPVLEGAVECDEVYIVVGHKGQPENVSAVGRPCAPVPPSQWLRGRGILTKDTPPVLGMIQRSEQVVIRMLANVRQQTVKPLITQHIAPKTQIYTIFRPDTVAFMKDLGIQDEPNLKASIVFQL